jgi:nitrate/nitrite transporter NarK
MAVRRARGVILRLVRHRRPAILVGLAMVVPAVWLEFSGRSDTWWLDGLGLVVGATGAALVWAGLTGTRPDWIDDG